MTGWRTNRTIAATNEIGEAIEEQFPEAERADALKVFLLVEKTMMTAVFQPLVVTLTIIGTGLLFNRNFPASFVCFLVTLVIMFKIIDSREKARRELNRLIQINSRYWWPINSKIREIMRNCKGMNDPLLRRQVAIIIKG